MTDEMIEFAPAWQRELESKGWTYQAIRELESALAKAGLGIRPREPTEGMLSSDAVIRSNQLYYWQAMWDHYEKSE